MRQRFTVEILLKSFCAETWVELGGPLNDFRAGRYINFPFCAIEVGGQASREANPWQVME